MTDHSDQHRINSRQDEPIFKSIFGDSWNLLPPALHKHYANRPYTDDSVIADGVINVQCSSLIQFLKPLFLLLGGIPPYTETQVPVTVKFESNKDSREFRFNRVFNFTRSNPYHFRSRMLQFKNNEVIEIMRFGITWRMVYLWENDRVMLKHEGYGWYLGGRLIPLPLSAFIGRTYAEEVAIDDYHFDMKVRITHPWWGELYSYCGRFKIREELR